MNLLTSSNVILISALALIVIGIISMMYQKSVKVERRKKKQERKPFLSPPDALGWDSGWIPSILGFVLILLGCWLLSLLAGQYAHDHPITPVPTPESFLSFFV